MVGRKCSLLKLKKKLGRCSNVKYTFGTLSQGKTQRWILAWSFEPRINFLSVCLLFNLACDYMEIFWFYSFWYS